MLAAASALLVSTGTVRAQAPCEQFNQCVTGVCQADGTCQTTPKPNTAACDDHNPCTVDDHCDGAGNCVSGGNAPTTTSCDDRNDCTTGDHCDGSGKCVGGGNKNSGDPCSLPGLGACASGTCEVFVLGFPLLCNASLKPCQDRCHFCNPSTGQCEAIGACSLDPCSTGECDPATGACVAANEGGPCTVLGLCANRPGSCHDAECFTTPQPTDTPSPETPTPTAGPATCVGDCDGSGQVTVDEILTMVNIALGNTPAMDCLAGDANFDGQITVDEILAAVNNALNGCPV